MVPKTAQGALTRLEICRGSSLSGWEMGVASEDQVGFTFLGLGEVTVKGRVETLHY